LTKNSRVSVIDASVGHVVTTLPAQNVFELGFSPLGTYMITWQRPTKDEDGNLNKNLKVWRTVDDNAGQEGERSVVGQFTQRQQTGWNLQYNADEKYCARVVTNEVQFYESGDLRTVWNKLRVEGVTDFALAPGKNPSVAVFLPEHKVRSIRLVKRKDYTDRNHRVSQLPSRSSMFLNSVRRCPKRLSSKATRSSSNGIILAPA
jgi:uncharacterized protein with WD repeat